ncbi:hypothetical protein K493DRAFT_315842 [Basidiobolus meristosporus CBS 931.73]|uniref:SET domain-containing protein n=1 Tax=Basidiobolus meristosporus CBS 931.73 TaxID=1314790 RepID=A0A1Y1Y765_9FUNG|nr:hypothetical protein K493DRAFT_315842 [Basidiobolus meristosporus CBS 931.73]|eukprot:ORX93735.1 hypothetical protein K493DRAFT_315842 [Basidiobolus meristosporus CBS 931.73]
MSRKANQPAGWPPGVTYSPTSVWANHVPLEVKEKYKPSNSRLSTHIPDPVEYILTLKQHEITPDGRKTKIKAITNPEHPCCGAYGLFAACHIEPKQHIVDYCGNIHLSDVGDTDPEIQKSDYVIRFTSELSIDAGRQGNEGRFVNDFRGVPKEPAGGANDQEAGRNKESAKGRDKGKGKSKGKGKDHGGLHEKSQANDTASYKKSNTTEKSQPTVMFMNYLDERTKEIRIGIFATRKIRKGDELLISYGKSFWRSRLGSVPSAFADASYD